MIVRRKIYQLLRHCADAHQDIYKEIDEMNTHPNFPSRVSFSEKPMASWKVSCEAMTFYL